MSQYALLVGAALASLVRLGIVEKASVNAAAAISSFFMSFPPLIVRHDGQPNNHPRSRRVQKPRVRHLRAAKFRNLFSQSINRSCSSGCRGETATPIYFDIILDAGDAGTMNVEPVRGARTNRSAVTVASIDLPGSHSRKIKMSIHFQNR
jgi:hypothetical protein